MNRTTKTNPLLLPDPRPKFHPYPFWAPRFWNGMRTRDWLRLVARHRFDVHPTRVPMLIAVTGCTLFNSVLSRLQNACLSRRIAQTPIHDSPVFIVGHWRSGTTYLHELLSLDQRFVSPTTFQCFAPHHFLLTEWILTRLLWLPSRRPMDNVKVGWKQPQEDEFAICAMGAPSPYVRLLFPNHEPEYVEYLDMDGVSERELQQWKDTMLCFMRRVSYRDPKPLLLKSPTHTGRLKVLLELFPKARFVHIVRDPYSVIPSTIRLWQSLEMVQGLQRPKFDQLVPYVFDGFDRLYRGFHAAEHLVGPRQMCTVRYEDLVDEPVEEVGRVYEQLGLGEFDAACSKLEQNVRASGDYKTNRYEIASPLREEITRRCADYMQRYGYSRDHAST